MSRPVRLLLVVLLVVGVTGVVWAATRGDVPKRTFCAGVGLITETRGVTPEAAFEAWARDAGYDPDDWVPSGPNPGSSAFWYEPRDGAANPSRFSSVEVAGKPSDFRVTGACVEGP
ncbi:MAG: hypothetical protein ACT452_13095 [Microthrixaceae bacterium]